MKLFSQKALDQDLESFVPKFCLIENSNEYMGSKANKKLIVWFYVLKTSSIWVPKCISKESFIALNSLFVLNDKSQNLAWTQERRQKWEMGSGEAMCLLFLWVYSQSEEFIKV